MHNHSNYNREINHNSQLSSNNITFCGLSDKLQEFWKKNNVTILPSYDLEMGAGTYHPFSTIKMMEKSDLSVCILQKCRRPYDAMNGNAGNRLYTFHQMQVILKPTPANILNLFFESLEYIGIDPQKNEIKFLESDWSSPSIGSYGIGWEVWCNGMEIAQFTYFKKIALKECHSPIVEIAYGVERLLLKASQENNIYNCKWDNNYSYKDICLSFEEDFYKAQKCFLSIAKIEDFNNYLEYGYKLLEENAIFHAYEYFIKACNIYNLLEQSNQLGNFQRNTIIKKLQQALENCFDKIS